MGFHDGLRKGTWFRNVGVLVSGLSGSGSAKDVLARSWRRDAPRDQE